MKVHVIKQTVSDTDKTGNKLISKKTGKPFYKIGIQTNEHGAQWINGLVNFPPNWEGTDQELEIYDEEYNGKTYKKFKIAQKTQGGLSENDQNAIQKTYEMASASNTNALRVVALIQELARELRDAGVIGQMNSDGSSAPDFEAEDIPSF